MTKKVISQSVVIKEPDIRWSKFHVRGTAPYVQHKFSEKAKRQMLDAQMSSQAAKKGKKEPRDIESDYQGAFHRTSDGKCGIPCPAFRAAMISACRVAGFQMTKAKLSVFIEADAYDSDDGTPLVIISGEPEMHMSHVRLESGVASISVRPMWRIWSCDLVVKYDGDQFTEQDVANLLERAGQQVGVGEGRPDSKKSIGMGWGTFTIREE